MAADTLSRFRSLDGETDPELVARVDGPGLEVDRLSPGDPIKAVDANSAAAFRVVTESAGRLLAADDGPRLAAISYRRLGHSRSGRAGTTGRLSRAAGRTGWRFLRRPAALFLADAWKDTVVAVVTESGRTARANGSDGTDHGTATAALLLGGAVKGGRTIADWPGLRDSDLLDNRDLKPTLDLRAVFKGLLRDHLGIGGTRAGDARVPGQHRRATARRLDCLNERRPPRRLGQPRPPITFDGSPYSIGETAFHLDDLSHHLGRSDRTGGPGRLWHIRDIPRAIGGTAGG